MNSPSRQLRALEATDADFARAKALESTSFGVEWSAADFAKWCDPSRTVAADVGGELAAIAHWYNAGHYLGGKLVPAIAVHSVSCRPEFRRQGHTAAVMTAVLDRARAEGNALASLFPASHAFYSRLGFGPAGGFQTWEAPLDAVAAACAAPRSTPLLRMRAGREADWPAMRELYHDLAIQHHGWLHRPGPFWDDWVPERWEKCWSVVLPAATPTDPDALDGYAVVRQIPVTPRGYDLEIVELLARSATARSVLWSTVASAAPLGRRVRWYGPPNDWLVARLAEPSSARVVDSWGWSTTVLDTARAVVARGHNGVVGSCVVAIRPPRSSGHPLSAGQPLSAGHLGADVETWRIECDGRDVAASPSHAAADLHVAATNWASIYMGWSTAAEQLRDGLIEGNAASANWLSALWTAPAPWLGLWF